MNDGLVVVIPMIVVVVRYGGEGECIVNCNLEYNEEDSDWVCCSNFTVDRG